MSWWTEAKKSMSNGFTKGHAAGYKATGRALQGVGTATQWVGTKVYDTGETVEQAGMLVHEAGLLKDDARLREAYVQANHVNMLPPVEDKAKA